MLSIFLGRKTPYTSSNLQLKHRRNTSNDQEERKQQKKKEKARGLP